MVAPGAGGRPGRVLRWPISPAPPARPSRPDLAGGKLRYRNRTPPRSVTACGGVAKNRESFEQLGVRSGAGKHDDCFGASAIKPIDQQEVAADVAFAMV